MLEFMRESGIDLDYSRQEPMPSWCSGDCLKKLTEWRETSRKRLSEVE